jgi:hypothetical protein
MKSLRIKRLYLLSDQEKAAREITFDPQRMVIVGENDTGKSSLIKSIYAAFGADAAKVHPAWKAAGVSSLIEFEVDGTPYSLLRYTNFLALYDASGAKLWTVSSIMKGLAPNLAELLGIELKMQSRDEEFVTPHPAYFFAPFYVDQDEGWQKNWNSFANMMAFPNHRESLALFHSGVRPNEFYAAQAEKIKADKAKGELTKERDAIDRAAKRLQANRKAINFDLKPEDFGERVEALTHSADALRVKQDVVMKRLSKLHSGRAVLIEQVAIAQATLRELDADFEFVRKSSDAEIVCPTCGTLHLNDFSNKFGLIADQDAARSFLLDARSELEVIDADIRREKDALGSFDSEMAAIESVLNETRGEVRLRDILEGESERLVDEAFTSERADLDASIAVQDGLSSEAQIVMKEFANPKRQKEIKGYFEETLRKFAAQLRVPTLPPSFFQSMHANPPETGSDQPRALLAYYLAFLHTVRKFTTAILAPVVIDSPVQQDQDPTNAKRMIQFALDNVPQGMQLILGTVRLHGATYDGATFELDRKYRLLQPDEYETVRNRLAPLLDSLI